MPIPWLSEASAFPGGRSLVLREPRVQEPVLSAQRPEARRLLPGCPRMSVRKRLLQPPRWPDILQRAPLQRITPLP